VWREISSRGSHIPVLPKFHILGRGGLFTAFESCIPLIVGVAWRGSPARLNWRLIGASRLRVRFVRATEELFLKGRRTGAEISADQ